MQVVFLVLMAVSAAQVLWWILDQAHTSRELHDRLRVGFAADVWAAVELLDRGMDLERLQQRYPHLELEARPIGVRAQVLDELDDRHRRNLRQYGWEGSFFLLVLVAGMVVVWRSIRQDIDLRHRQQNFLAAVSHEFKSPLASLQLAAETMALREPPADRRRKLVQRMLADLERLGVLVSNLLDASRLEQGELQPNPVPLSLAEVVRSTCEEMVERARDAGCEISRQVADDLHLHADPVAARTVVRNLLDNAIKATQLAGGGEIRLRGERRGERVVLQVEDDGVGFPSEEAERLFEQFYRLGDELRRSSPGTGLGLYITRRFAALDGGTVSASSEGPGQGATMTATWPAAPDRAIGGPPDRISGPATAAGEDGAVAEDRR
ncbi:MAG: HAMP domain-containing histidine kinase [Holophagales bacterium]|nr:HAMP domain-containing histidine kinase [Holophagales bacterium]